MKIEELIPQMRLGAKVVCKSQPDLDYMYFIENNSAIPYTGFIAVVKGVEWESAINGAAMIADDWELYEGIKTYLIYNPNNNLYQIGKSKNPSKSVSLLRYIESSNLEILYVVHEDLESELRNKFAIHCHAGEWFTDEGSSMQAYFKEMSEKAISND